MLPKTTRQDQKENTRRSLIQAALTLFSEEGIASTSTAQVARILNVSHGTVFVHFPAREDLLSAVIDEFGARLSQEFQETVSVQSELAAVLKAHLRALSHYEDFYFRLLTEMQELPGSVRSTAFMLNAAVSYKVYEVAAPLMKSGKFKKIERHLLFNTWMSLIQYYVSNRDLLSEKKPILKEKGELLLKHFLTLIQT